MVECPGELGRAAGSALLVAAAEPLPHAAAFLHPGKQAAARPAGPGRLHGHSRPQPLLPLRRAGLGLASGCKQWLPRWAAVLRGGTSRGVVLTPRKLFRKLFHVGPQFPHLISEGFGFAL